MYMLCMLYSVCTQFVYVISLENSPDLESCTKIASFPFISKALHSFTTETTAFTLNIGTP